MLEVYKMLSENLNFGPFDPQQRTCHDAQSHNEMYLKYLKV